MTSTDAVPAARTSLSAEERYASHRARREERVASAQGPLALEGTYRVAEAPREVFGVPGAWRLDATADGVLLEAQASDGILIDGTVVDGTVPVAGARCAAPAAIAFADGRRGAVIRDGLGEWAVRVWNPSAEAIAQFGGILAHDYDPAWVFEARVEATPDARLAVQHVRTGEREDVEQQPAEIVFERHGVEHRLAALQDDAGLLISFRDAGSGVDHYGAARFLMLTPRRDGTVTLDFNRAYLPPCAFAYGWNCPIPPAQNRFDFAIPAGERQALDRTGAVLEPRGVYG